MATVGQVLDETEDYLRSQLKQFGFSDRCKLSNVVASKGSFSGRASEDSETWYKFVISDTDTEIFED